MSENRPANQSRGFFGFFKKEENKDPPPKEMKLGKSGAQRFDPVKKRWVFEGDEEEETQDFLPPPKTFLKNQAEVRTGSRKLYVDVLKLAEGTENSYAPANVDDNNCGNDDHLSERQGKEKLLEGKEEENEKNTGNQEGMIFFGSTLKDEDSLENQKKNQFEGSGLEDNKKDSFDCLEKIGESLNKDQVKMIRDCLDFKSFQCFEGILDLEDSQTDGFQILSENEKIKVELLQKDFEVFKLKTLNKSLKSLNFQVKTQAFQKIEDMSNNFYFEVSKNEALAEELDTLKSVLLYEQEKVSRSEEKIKSLSDCLAEESLKNNQSKELLEKLYDKDREIHAKYEELHLKDQEIHLKDQEIHLKDQEIHSKSQEISLKNQEIHSKDLEIGSLQVKIQNLEIEILNLSQTIKSSEAENSKENNSLVQKISDLTNKIKSLEEYNGQQSKKNRKLESENRQLLNQIQESNSKVTSSETLEKSKIFTDLLRKTFFKYIEKVSELEIENLGLEERIKYLSNIVPENIEISHSNPDHQKQVKELRENMEKVTKDRDLLQRNLQDLLQDYQKTREDHFLDLEREKNNFEHALNRINTDLNNEKLLTGQLKQQITLFKQELTEKDSVLTQIRGKFSADLEKFSFRKKVLKEKNKKISEIVEVQNKKLQENNGKIKFLETIIKDLEETLSRSKEIENVKSSDKYQEKKRIITEQNEKIQDLTEENKLLQSTLLKSQQDLEDLNNDFQFTKDTLKDLEESLKIIQNKYQESSSLIKNFQDLLLSKDSELEALNEAIAELTQVLNETTEKTMTLSLELKKSQENLQVFKESEESLIKKAEDLKFDLTSSNQNLENLKNSFQSLSSNYEEKIEQLLIVTDEKSQLLIQVKELETQNFEILGENKDLLQKVTESEEKNSFLNELKVQLEAEIKNLQCEISEIQKKHEELLKDHSTLAIHLEDTKLAHSESSKYFEILQNQDEEIENLKKIVETQSNSLKSQELSFNTQKDSLENQLLQSLSTIKSLESSLNTLKSENSEDSKQKNEILKLQDQITRLKQENDDLNEDLENLCSKNLSLTQKISAFANTEQVLKEKTSENASLQGIILEKDLHLARLDQRLAEKDEELALAKQHFQELLKGESEKVKKMEDEYEIPESLEESNEESETRIVGNPDEGSWSISRLLSAIFLTDSERGEGRIVN